MIEWLSNTVQLGYYEYAEKINYMQILITTSVGTVMLPYMSFLQNKNDEKSYNKTIYLTLQIVMIVAVGLSFGIMALSNEFIEIYLGSNHDTTANILTILSISGIAVTFANIIRTMYLLPKKQDNIYIKSVLLGAIINLGLNIIFIYKLGGIGAAISTVITEFIVAIYQIIKIRNEFSIRKVNKYLVLYFITGIFMYIILNNIHIYIYNKILTLIFKVLLGGAIYISIIYLLNIKENNKIIINIKDKIINSRK